MRARILTVLLVIGLLSVFAADFTVGCGPEYVYGSVTQKINGGNDRNTIMVNGQPYDVPLSFFERVQVGNMVRFDGREWSIVKPSQSPNVPVLPAPATAPSAPPSGQPGPATAPSTP